METEIMEFIEQNYCKGDLIYPSVISYRLKIDIMRVYSAIEKNCVEKSVERIFEVYCRECKKLTGIFYNNFISIKNQEECPHCKSKIDRCYADALIVYKRL